LIERLRRLGPRELALLNEDELVDVQLVLTEAERDRVDTLCAQTKITPAGASEHCGCLYWLQNFTRTVDDHALSKGTAVEASFPEKSYFRPLLRAMLQPVVQPSLKCQSLFIPKTREMMTSWLACGYIAWLCQWKPGTFYILQTAKEEKVSELIRYIRLLWENQEPWLQERHPQAFSTGTTFGWRNGSHVLGVPSGEDQIRIYHPFGYMMDEAAFLIEAQQCYDTVFPVAKQIIAVSSAGPGWFANECAH
jgi:hypothetical protein